MTAAKHIVAVPLALGALLFAAVSATSTATAESAVTGQRERTTCYVFGLAPIGSVELVLSLGEC